MSLLSGLAGGLGEAYGAATSLGGLLPNAQATKATNIGHAITNPNLVLSNPGAILDAGKASAFTPTAQPVAAQTGATPIKATTAAPSGPVTDTSSGAASSAGGTPAEYSLYTGNTNDALARALAAYNNTNSNIASTSTQQQNALNSSVAQAQQGYQQGITQNQQDKLANDNAINQQSNAGYQSLLRVLGGIGAGGGSEAQYLAPELAQQQASQQLGAAGQTYATNAKANDTTYNNFLDQEKGQQAQLNDYTTGQQAQNQATYAATKQSLLGILSGLQSQAAPAADLATELNNIVGQIPNTVAQNPTYSGTTPTYTAPSLSSYELAANPTAQVQLATPAGSSLTPYTALLQGLQKKQTAIA